MTKFTGPLHVGALDNATDFVTIDASGTASFAAPVVVGALQVGASGGTIFSTIDVSGTASFEGPIRGPSGVGTALLVQSATIAANTTAGAPATFALPSGADIIDFKVSVEIPFATGAGVTAANIEVSAAAGLTMAIVPVSASGTYRPALIAGDTASFRNVIVVIEAHVSIQGSPTAITVGQAMLSLTYIHNA